MMSKINLNSKKGRGKPSRKSRGNYASFSLCIAAAVITISAAAVRAHKDRAALSAEPSDSVTSSYQTADAAATTDANSSATAAGENTTQSTKAANTDNTAATDTKKDSAAPADEFEDFEDSEQTLAIQVLGKNLTYVRPTGGAVTKDYSMSGLVYSKTMGDWRVHNGIDISANKGEVVKSAAEGKVAGITEDPLYGTTVVINQNDGLMVYYRGLAKDTAVRQGENISAGATIGIVGEIPCESDDGIHLHIEVMSEGKYLNPAETLGIK